MDGYAVNSQVTQTASEHTPVICQVVNTSAAGGEEIIIKSGSSTGINEETAAGGKMPICVEIMTGARFPRLDSTDSFDVLDCCVKVEDTRPLSTNDNNTNFTKDGAESTQRLIQILKPARPNQNKRLAGENFRCSDLVVDRHVMIRSNHVMVLASVGYESVEVLRRPRLALFSTGAEIVSTERIDGTSKKQQVADVNGPYIMSVLQETFACEVEFLGILEDNPTTAEATILDRIKSKHYDMVITTGAVSMGRFDFVPKALEMLNASIVFHKVAMKPGHPALFAKIPSLSERGNSTIPFFGLPGNPVAAAACLRFLLFPFLRSYLFQDVERPRQAVVRSIEMNGEQVGSKVVHDPEKTVIATFPSDRDIFRPGTIINKVQNNL
jgi:molybdopterin molybdotransferase